MRTTTERRQETDLATIHETTGATAVRSRRPGGGAGAGPRHFPSPMAEALGGRGAARRARHRPVFVDDSGRRRRVARAVSALLASGVAGYVAVVAATFAGLPFVGSVAPPGIGSLTRPSGEPGADVGTDPVEVTVPAAVADAGGDGDVAVDPDADAGPSTSVADGAPGAPSAGVPPATSTTTTTVHGNSAATPSSTVPGRGGGPPDSRPGPK